MNPEAVGGQAGGEAGEPASALGTSHLIGPDVNHDEIIRLWGRGHLSAEEAFRQLGLKESDFEPPPPSPPTIRSVCRAPDWLADMAGLRVPEHEQKWAREALEDAHQEAKLEADLRALLGRIRAAEDT